MVYHPASMASKQKLIVFFLILTGTLLLSLPMIRSGWQYPYGIGFFGPNAHDSNWHLSLINHIRDPFKIPLGAFSGEYLKNYHPFYNIFIAFITKITGISASFLVFQVFPLVSSALILYLSFVIGFKLTNKFESGIFLMVLNIFASSAGFLVTLVRFGQLGGESLFWSMQSASTQLNPPYSLSLLFILIIIAQIVSKNYQKYDLKIAFLTIILLCLTPITKVYGGVALYILFGLFSLSQFKNKNYYPLVLLLISLPIAYSLFVRYNTGSGNMLIFKPFWFSNSMIESPDRFYLPQIANMRYTLESSGRIGPRLLAVNLFAFIIFIIGNFFWRLLGILSLNNKNKFHLILFISIIFLILIPTFFIQSGTSWNTIQFLYYALVFGNVLLASYLASIKPKIPRYILLLVILATSILSNLDIYKNYLGSPSPAAIFPPEIEALDFLSNQKPGIILTPSYNSFIKNEFNHTPIPLYAYETTSYLSAYTPHLTYLADEMNMANSGYDWKFRKEATDKFFSQKNKFEDRGFLVNNQIDYIYLVDRQLDQDQLDLSNLSLVKIFDNSYVRIYQVQR